MNQDTIIEEVKLWVNKVVIGENFCPFAKRVVDDQAVAYVVELSGKKKAILESLLELCVRLEQNEPIETALLIAPEGFNDFLSYLDMLEMAENLLSLEGYEGVYQLASFHPDYCFEGEEQDDPANYTNRSPYPIFHLLKESSLEKAIAFYPNPEQIPENNIQHARQRGLAYMQNLLRLNI